MRFRKQLRYEYVRIRVQIIGNNVSKPLQPLGSARSYRTGTGTVPYLSQVEKKN
jgi:hypothetical protein